LRGRSEAGSVASALVDVAVAFGMIMADAYLL
jgi:hypothetical protein